MSERWESQGDNSVLVVVWGDTSFSSFGVFCFLHGLLEEVKAGLREDFLPDKCFSVEKYPLPLSMAPGPSPDRQAWSSGWVLASVPSCPSSCRAVRQCALPVLPSAARPSALSNDMCCCSSLHQEITKKSLFTSQTLNTLHPELSMRERVEQQPCRFKAVPEAQAACFLAQVSPAQAPITAPQTGRPGEGRFS